jgi:hypothetical protein
MVNETELNMVNETQLLNLFNKDAAELKQICDRLFNDPDSLSDILREEARQQIRRKRERTIRNNASFAQLLSQTTDKQAHILSMKESDGYKVNKVYFNRTDPRGNVAIMLVKAEVWNGEKGRMGRKLAMLYSDGTIVSTFEKSINIRKVL